MFFNLIMINSHQNGHFGLAYKKGVTHWTSDVFGHKIHDNIKTLPQILKNQNYKTLITYKGLRKRKHILLFLFLFFEKLFFKNI